MLPVLRLRPLLLWIFYTHPLLTCLWMFVSVIVFGLASYNLFSMLHSNVSLIAHFGTDGLREGGLEQLIELTRQGVISLVSYLMFRSCEKVLIENLTRNTK